MLRLLYGRGRSDIHWLKFRVIIDSDGRARKLMTDFLTEVTCQ